MTEQEIRALGTDCYAAFNQKAPDYSSSAWRLWAEICASVPIEAAAWIRGKLIELDALPRNFGMAVRNLASDWRSSTGQKREMQRPCPECDREWPGFFAVWRHDGTQVLVKCQCNRDPYHATMPAMTRAMAARRVYDEKQRLAYIVPPAGVRNIFFQNEHFPPRGVTPGEMAGLARSLAASPVPIVEERDYDDAMPF